MARPKGGEGKRGEERRRCVLGCRSVGGARRHHNYHHRRSNKITIIIIIISVVVVVIGLKSWASMLLRSRSLARDDASVSCWRNWSPEANLSLSLFVLSSGIISVKDEDVVACGNFHLVVIRSLAERRITSVFDAAAAFPSLFSPSDENCSSLSSGPLLQELRRTNGANATRSDRGERSPIKLLWSSGVILAIAGNGLFS